jgi:ATP-dependent DNA helicase RecQ
VTATPDLEQVLRGPFGLTEFRPGQREVIEALLRDGAALAVFPTGGGKSLCYQLPALLLPGVTLVVSPLIALMKDQIDFLTRRGISAARLDSSLSVDEVRAVGAAARGGGLKLLYVAPERFTNERFLEMLGRLRVSLFAVDEAHSISEWGHNFRPDYLKLAAAAKRIGAERVLALTATATPAVVESICAGFAIKPECAIVTGFYRHNLELRVTPVSVDIRDDILLKHLRAHPPGPAIVYVTLQKTAERVAALLAAAGFAARAYHAGLDADTRAAVQEQWMASERGVVVATIAFGMGIDKADVRSVVHYNLPKSLESYSQEIGRAGRDGAPAVVELLAAADDLEVLEGFACGDTPTREALAALVHELLAAGPLFARELGELGDRHDLRPLVLKTALTHLELAGVLRQLTPFYATYQARLNVPLAELIGMFAGERAEFLAAVFAAAKPGRIWYTIDTEAVAAQLGQDRMRIVKALEWLAEQGKLDTQVRDLRHRFERTDLEVDPEALIEMLAQRFADHEARELARLRGVLALVTADTCQTNALVLHFGERRDRPCGHCTHCHTGAAVVLPPRRPLPPLDSVLDDRAIAALREQHPLALGHPRQLARFLCGLASPAVARARLGKHALFGVTAERRFHEVLDWCCSRGS